MRNANGTALAFCERLCLQRVVRTAVSRVRPRVSHPDYHMGNIPDTATKEKPAPDGCGDDLNWLADAAFQETDEPILALGAFVGNEVLAQRSREVEADAVSMRFALLLVWAVVHLSAY
jgi:hypothetical protein